MTTRHHWPQVLHGPAGAWHELDRNYRMLLWRRWSDASPLIFVMLNPSTADARKDDPTIRKCCGFARRHGHGGIVVVNLSPYRATKPTELTRAFHAGTDVFGGSEAWEPVRLAISCGPVVLAWGGSAPQWLDLRKVEMARLCPDALCLGLTDKGEPRHPLMLTYSTPLVSLASALAARAQGGSL